jgi:hypothetical protein
MSYQVDLFALEPFLERLGEDLGTFFNGRGGGNASDEDGGAVRFEDLTDAAPMGDLEGREGGRTYRENQVRQRGRTV